MYRCSVANQIFTADMVSINRTHTERLFGAQYAQELLFAAHRSADQRRGVVSGCELCLESWQQSMTSLRDWRLRQLRMHPLCIFQWMKTEKSLLSFSTLVRCLYALGELTTTIHWSDLVAYYYYSHHSKRCWNTVRFVLSCWWNKALLVVSCVMKCWLFLKSQLSENSY